MTSKGEDAARRDVSPSPSIAVNTRVLLNPLTGVQRYTQELLLRLGDMVRPVQPRVRMTSVLNQGWEQGVLPLHLHGRLLWSPANTGPLLVDNQVLTLHDMAPLDHPEWYHSSFSHYMGWLLPRLARRVRYVITVSEFSRDRIAALTGIPPAKIAVIPSAVSGAFFDPAPTEIREVCSQFELTPDSYVLYLGSIEPRKNLSGLLSAWESCRRRLPSDVILAIAGERANPRAFKNVSLPGETEHVRWLGRVEDGRLPALLAGARAFVYVSLYEGFGAPPLEALAAGTPVLTSSATSIPEVVGEAALLVDPTDVDAIARGIERLVTDAQLRGRLREAGPLRARKFTWEMAAARTRDLLHELA